MIVRLWRGRVASSRAEEYRIYQEEVGPPGYRKIPGIRRIYMLGRDLGEQYEIAMLTFWDSLDVIRAFAGDPVDKARYYDRDFEFLIDPPDKVEHFDLLESANLTAGSDARERIVRLWRGRAPAARKREAIRAFADDPIDRANYDEYRRRGLDYLVDLPEAVEHFDVIVAEKPADPA